jgi:vitamin K-dependent gamma-carboxylase
MAGSFRRALDRLHAPVDIAPLVYLRIVFGAVMLWEVFRYFDHGWIDRYYDPSDFHFTYFGFEWVKPWPGRGMHLHFVALGVAATCIAVGLFYRIATAFFFFAFSYVFLLEEAHYLNHLYLVCLITFLLIFVPAHRSCSLDAYFGRTRRSDVAPVWSLWLMRAQIAIPYVFGGIAKLNADWLQGEPMRMWLARRADYPILGNFVEEEYTVWFFTIGGLLFDLLIVPALLWHRTRVPALLAATSFHLLNAWIFRIGIFPWLMLASTLVFFPPERARQLLRFLRFPMAERAMLDADEPSRSRVAVPLMTLYLAVQVLMPLRHFHYPGNVNWTEEGHRFAWHMKLRGKDGEVVFPVRDPVSGREWTVDPDKRLPSWRVKDMATHPEMILQYAHEVARIARERGYDNVEVRARSRVSLNGRRAQPLIDPTVDLTKERRSLRPAGWILPLTEPLRPRRRR